MSHSSGARTQYITHCGIRSNSHFNTLSMKVLFLYDSGGTFKPNSSKAKEQVVAESCPSTPIILKVIPAYKLPPPVLRIRIPYTQQTVDIFQKKHTAYHMFLKQGRLSWRVVKRYSDFVKLVEQVREVFGYSASTQTVTFSFPF